ncbi:MAG: DNA polymerase IV [Chloroflexota bacterium]
MAAPGQSDVPARCVAHCDADRFYYAVEALDRPEIASEDRPVIIGHDPRSSPRSIVTTANDAARKHGVNSGMSAAQALRLVPDALFVAPRHELYREYSDRLMAVLRAASPVVQQLSIDEAWLDWTAVGFSESATRALRERVLAQTGLSVSVGVASSKLVSKMATELAKPGGVKVVGPGQEAEFLAPLPARALIGIGPRSAERLEQIGVRTIGDIAARPLPELVALLGPSHGHYLQQSALGIDDSALEPERQPKSYSAEHTFQRDTGDARALWQELRAQADEVAHRLTSDGYRACEVAIKLRYEDFQTVTRQTRLESPSEHAQDLASAAAGLMRRHWERHRPVRLIGLRASRLVSSDEPFQLSLWKEPERGD